MCIRDSFASLFVFEIIVYITTVLSKSNAQTLTTLTYILLLTSFKCDTVDYVFCVWVWEPAL